MFFGRLKRQIAALLSIPCIILLSDSANADGNPPVNEPSEILITAPIIEKGHYGNSVGISDAASEGVVRAKMFQDQPLLRSGEVLETVPGLVVTQHSGDGKANQYFLRGYNLDHGTDFASSVDGVPVNMPTNAHGQGYADLNFLIPELVEKIDYRKGPYYAENGDFSSAGSADIQYRHSLDRNFADLTAGGFGYRRALFAGSTLLNSPDSDSPVLLGAFEVMHNDGPWTSPENLHKVNGLLRLGKGNQAKGWSLDSMYYGAGWNSTDQIPLSLIDSGQLGRYSALDPTDGGDTGRAVLSGEWHENEEKGYTKVLAYVEHYRLQLWSNFTFFELRSAIAPNSNLPSDQFEQSENRDVYGSMVAKGWSHGLFGHRSTTEIGLQIRHDNIHVSLLDTQSRVPFDVVTSDLVSETQTGVYVQNTTHWTSWFRTIVGLREDLVAMDMTSYVIPQNSGATSAKKLLPKFSAIFGPRDKTEFFFNAGRGFHSNDARGVIDRIDPTTGTPASPVPALAGSFGKEIGMRTEMIRGLQSSLALWSLDSDSELVYNADSVIGSTSPNGASKRYGVEWDNHLVVNHWLLIDANTAWTHARYANINDNGSTGNLIPNAVSKVGLIRTTLHDLGFWTAGLETRYIGSYPLSQDGSLTAPSATVTNLRVQRKLSPDVALSLDLLNLLNRQYYDIAYQQDYRVSAASLIVPSGITVHPGEPRQLRVSLRIAY